LAKNSQTEKKHQQKSMRYHTIYKIVRKPLNFKVYATYPD